MTAALIWIDAFINLMQGLVIGAFMSLLFVGICWLVAIILKHIHDMFNVTADPKHVYPPYIKGVDDE